MIHKPAIPRIVDHTAEGLRMLFEALIEDAEKDGREVGQVSIPLIDPNDEFVVGEWVPEFWLVVRKVL